MVYSKINKKECKMSVKFIDGLSVKKAPVDWFCINGSINIEKFKRWLEGEGAQFIQRSEYGAQINFKIVNSQKTGEPYICLNEYKSAQGNNDETA
jgi:hypothetical protein